MEEHTPQRVALVTGGAVRLGRAISVGLAEAGYDICFSYMSSRKPALEVQSEITGLDRRCEMVQADLSEPSGSEDAVEAARRAFGRIDLLVNSAASFHPRPLLEVDADAWDETMHLNARAPHLVVRAAADLLRATRGSVVNITDLSAFQPWTAYPDHSVAKAALTHLTRVQARALAPEVRVNGVAPGAVLPPEEWPEERRQALADATPLKRVGSPEDVVGAVLFFAQASFVTGQILAVDGGRLLGPAGPPE